MDIVDFNEHSLLGVSDADDLNSNSSLNDEYLEYDLLGSYFRDISLIDNKLSDDDKKILIKEIVEIVGKLNQFFVLVGCDQLKFDNGRYGWIIDKVLYCEKECSDYDLVKNIKELYNKFVFKRNILMGGYLKFVISLAKVYYRKDCISLLELIQFGNLGLMRAIENYNDSYGVEFITYAGMWINQSILANSKKIMYQVKKPFHIFQLNNLRVKAINELSQKYGRFPSISEIANYMGEDIETVKLIESAFLESISLDLEVETIYDGVYATMKDLIVDESINIEEEIMDEFLTRELMEYLESFLSERDLFIIKNRYFADKTFFEIGQYLGITYQGVGQRHSRVLRRLSKNKKIRELKKTYFG